MKFDKAKVITPFNCDGVKIGSKGYVADSRADLIARVTREETERYYTLVNINLDDTYPFKTKENGCWEYFYLVEEPKEKTKRPCNREELLEILKKQGVPMLKRNLDNTDCIVESIGDTGCFVYGCGCGYTYQSLCNQYTILDGTELWVEE